MARVLRPEGLVAAWSYERCAVTPEVDAVFARLYGQALGAWWPPERRHVESGYATLPFPYAAIDAPSFTLRCDWKLAQYLAYLRSWSACQRKLAAEGIDAVGVLADEFAAAWGDADVVRVVSWPLALRVGRQRA